MPESPQNEFERDRQMMSDIFQEVMGASPVDVQPVPAETIVSNPVVVTEAIDTQKPLQQRGRRGASRRKAHGGHVVGPDGGVQTTVEQSVAGEGAPNETIDPYAEIKPGQVWVKNTPEGGRIEKTITNIINGYVSISETETDPDGSTSMRAGSGVDARSIERLQGLLREEGYRLKVPATKNTSEALSATQTPWTEERLLAEIADGREFTLVGSGGERDEYVRKGNYFELKNGHGSVPSGFLADALAQQGWSLELGPEVSPVAIPKPDASRKELTPFESIFLIPSPADAPIRKAYRFADLKGDEFQVARIGEKWYRMKLFGGGLGEQVYSGEQMLGLALDGKWNLLSERGLEPRDLLSDDSSEVVRLPIEAGRNPLEKVQADDIWELRRPDGSVESQLVVDDVAETKGKIIVYFDQFLPHQKRNQLIQLEDFQSKMKEEGWVCDYRRENLSRVAQKLFMRLPASGEEIEFGNSAERVVVRGVAGGKGTVVYDIIDPSTGNKIGPFPYDQALTYLAQNQFSPVKKDEAVPEQPKPEQEGSLTDLPEEGKAFQYTTSDGKRIQVDWAREGAYQVSDVLQGTVLGELDEIGLRARMTAERWRRAKTLIDTKKLQDIEDLDRALTSLKKELETTRADYVRLEMEESSVMKVIAQTLRQLRGREEINPELSVLRAAYQHELTTIQDFEIRKLKLLDLEGKALHEAIAGVVREYDFTEAETLHELRRKYAPEDKRSLYEKSKALWEATRKKEEYFDEHAGFKTREYHDGWKFFVGATKLAAEAGWKATKMVGEGYNRLNKRTWGKAITIGTGVVGGGILAFSSGGAAVAVAGLAITGKRVLGGIGLGLAANEVMESYSRGRREKKSIQKSEIFLGKEMASDPEAQIERILSGESDRLSPEAYERLQAWLKRETVNTVVKKQAKLDRGVLYRQSGAVLIGFLAAAGLGKIRDVIEYGSAAAPNLPIATAQAADAASVPSRGVGLPGVGMGGPPVEVAQPAAAAVSAPTGVTDVAQAPSIPRTEATGILAKSTLLAQRTVAPGDTLWKYAVESGKGAGLDEQSQTRFATLLREKINEKLATASTVDIKAAGFQTNSAGKLSADYLQSKKTLHLGKLITSDELSQLMSQAKQSVADDMSVGMPNANLSDAAEATLKASASGLSTAQELTLSGKAADIALIQGAEAMKEAGVRSVVTTPMSVARVVEATAPAITLSERMATLGKGVSVVDYIRGLSQDEQGEIFRTMRRTVRDLFNTPETNIFGGSTTQYLFSDHPEFARVPAVKVLADHATLQNGSLFFYDREANPLHWTQMQEIAKFSEVATKTLGKEIGMPIKNESIEGYVLRITTVARGLGKTLSGYRMLN